MTDAQQKQLGEGLWSIATNHLRGTMNADDFRDYMLSFLFLRYLSVDYESEARKELQSDYDLCQKVIEEATNGSHDILLNRLNVQMSDYFFNQLLLEKTEIASSVEIEDKQKELELAEKRIKKIIDEYEKMLASKKLTPLIVWYIDNLSDVSDFEKQMRRRVHFIIRPQYLWSNIAELARTQNKELLTTLQNGFRFIENKSFDSTFKGLFSEVNLDSDKLGKNYEQRNNVLCSIITAISNKLAEFKTNGDLLGTAYEYLIEKFAAGSGKKAGEFYTPQPVSTILSRIVTLDGHDPSLGPKPKLKNVLDFACGSGSLLINVKSQTGKDSATLIYGQEKNVTTYNLARMNMLLHGFNDSEFQIFHGDSLFNDWSILNEMNPAKKWSLML